MTTLKYFHGINLDSTTIDIQYKLHPVVVLSILDHYKRRTLNSSRVVGTLLGERKGDTIYIKNSFPVPHDEQHDQVAVDMEYHRTMLSLYQRVHSKQFVVGWYSTGDNISYLSSLIHGVYRNEVHQSSHTTTLQPVHILVDVSLNTTTMPINAYTSQNISYQQRDICSVFESVSYELHAYESERIGVDALINGVPVSDELDAPATMLGDIDNLQHAMIRLLDALEICSAYVDRVCSGDETANIELGEQISNALQQIPNIDTLTFQNMFTTHLQDLLMLVYLANITHTQVNIADKVATLIV